MCSVGQQNPSPRPGLSTWNKKWTATSRVKFPKDKRSRGRTGFQYLFTIVPHCKSARQVPQFSIVLFTLTRQALFFLCKLSLENRRYKWRPELVSIFSQRQEEKGKRHKGQTQNSTILLKRIYQFLVTSRNKNKKLVLNLETQYELSDDISVLK